MEKNENFGKEWKFWKNGSLGKNESLEKKNESFKLKGKKWKL